MSVYQLQVREVIRATHFHSAGSFSWFGERSYRLSARVRRSLTSHAARGYLLFTLQHQLYTSFYCTAGASPSPSIPTIQRMRPETPLARKLSEANRGNGLWETGWQVRSISGDEICVRRGALELRARRAECRLTEGERIEVGCQVSVFRGKELLGISPGFYFVLGDRQLTTGKDEPLVRLYWHLTAFGAMPFVQVATRLLNASGLPFHLKVTNDPSHFTRCDAAVLYMHKRDYPASIHLLAQVYGEVAEYLRPDVPAFTKRLAPGLALAEDPAPRDSFGLNRCRLLADGLIRAHEKGARSEDARLRVVEERFAEEGVNLETPFLNPGSVDTYAFPPVLPADTTLAPALSSSTCGCVTETESYLNVATQIGHHLVRDAIWHDERCTWIGPQAGTELAGGQNQGLTYHAVGPDVYDGTAGVGLFLAELHAATGESEIRRTAVGALWQSLACASTLPPLERLGFFTGWPGIALVAAHSAALLGEEALLCATRQMVERRIAEDVGGTEHDFIFGKAGAIVALLALRPILDDPRLLDTAILLGDDLVRNARQTGAGHSWRLERSPFPRNLTGLSHGAAGIGYALLEIAVATGQARFREAADRAFDYERHWFDAELGNWPDFRMSQPRHGPPICSTSWCHGAPGIALTRLRASALTGDVSFRAEAKTALATTRAGTEKQLASHTENYSLCHGLAGNAAILAYRDEYIEDGREANQRVARAVARSGIERYATRGAEWPCGSTGREDTPGLMLGLAGIGYFYLCLRDPTLPNILLPQPAEWGNRLGISAAAARAAL